MKKMIRIDYNLSKRRSDKVISSIGSTLGSSDEMIRRFRILYKSSSLEKFNALVKQVWLENTFLLSGVRRKARSGNGFTSDSIFGFFFKALVGTSQKIITDGFYPTAIPTYFQDFFPDFSDHDPDLEPEYFAFPYKHLTLDHLGFVYQLHNRLELLKEADERAMSYHDFVNWVTPKIIEYALTQPMCHYRYRDGRVTEVPCYMMRRWHSFIPYLGDMRKRYG